MRTFPYESEVLVNTKERKYLGMATRDGCRSVQFRITFVFTALFLVISAANAQEMPGSSGNRFTLPAHNVGDFTLSAAPVILFNTPNGNQFGGALKISMFVGKHVSFDSDFAFANYYWHGGPGLIGIPLWLFAMNSESLNLDYFIVKLLFMILSAEHITFHVPVNNRFEISPYLSLLRYKSAREIGNNDNPRFAGDQLTFATGIELNKYFNRFRLSPYVEYQVGYKDKLGGINAGVWLGIYIFARRDK